MPPDASRCCQPGSVTATRPAPTGTWKPIPNCSAWPPGASNRTRRTHMSDLAPLIQGYFTRRLLLEQGAGPNTIACYRDTIRLLVSYICQQTGKQPARQSLADLDTAMISAFLDHLETSRGNSITTRNTRLAVIHALFRYAALTPVDQPNPIHPLLATPLNLP